MRPGLTGSWTAILAATLGVGHATAQLPDGPGKTETVKVCSACHAPEVATALRQNRAGWVSTVQKMATLGAKGTEAELGAVVDYLAMHFPATELPPINVNTATAIELESGLTLRRSQAAAIIAYRAQHGPFKTFDDLGNVPGLDLSILAAKKQRLTF